MRQGKKEIKEYKMSEKKVKRLERERVSFA